MYFSLNKKIFYTLFILLVFTSLLFFGLFFSIYLQKFAQDQNSVSLRNQYVIELLKENILLKQKLSDLEVLSVKDEVKDLTIDLQNKERELWRERQLNIDLQNSYHQRLAAFSEGGRIILTSSMLSIISILILILLLRRWVMRPVKKLTDMANMVKNGDFSKRIRNKHNKFYDEFDTLIETFNQMTDNIENNISEIREKEQFLQSLIDAIPDGIRVINQDCRVVLANKSYLNKFLKNKESQSKRCFAVYDDEKPCLNLSGCPLQARFKKNSKNMVFIRNIDRRPLSVNAAVLPLNHSENDFYVVESIRDLSDEIQFSHEQKISSLAFLATSLSHEMKNNLGSMRMILEGLLETGFKDLPETCEEKKYLNLVYQQIVESVKIPERLLKLTQQNTNEKEMFFIKESVMEVFSLLDYEAKHNGVSLVCEGSEGKVYGNVTDFKMIILNLSQNAITAMPTGGELKIEIKQSGNFAVLKVSDTGMGIEKDKLERIFEPFYTYSATAKRQGTGLGLAIVKSLVGKFRGQISVSSVKGKGTVFEIKLPKSARKKLQNAKNKVIPDQE